MLGRCSEQSTDPAALVRGMLRGLRHVGVSDDVEFRDGGTQRGNERGYGSGTNRSDDRVHSFHNALLRGLGIPQSHVPPIFPTGDVLPWPEPDAALFQVDEHFVQHIAVDGAADGWQGGDEIECHAPAER